VTTIIKIDNLKCGGCGGSIKKGLKTFSLISEVYVDISQGTVEIVHEEYLDTEHVERVLRTLGYPERNTVTGLDKITAEVKPYLSCV
jgi:copper chaperone